MTKEQAIEEINKAFEPAFANYIITALTEGATVSDKALEQQPSDDCVSRQAVLETIEDCNSDGLKDIFCSYNDGERFKEYINKLPPVTPTQCIATIRFSKEDLRDICNERIEVACEHGTCKDCKHWMPYDWMFSEVLKSKNMDDYPEDEIGCAYCDMNMSANDFCSRGERKTNETD
jgi:hypothetical protein